MSRREGGFNANCKSDDPTCHCCGCGEFIAGVLAKTSSSGMTPNDVSGCGVLQHHTKHYAGCLALLQVYNRNTSQLQSAIV